jgi:hypothetical protein
MTLRRAPELEPRDDAGLSQKKVFPGSMRLGQARVTPKEHLHPRMGRPGKRSSKYVFGDNTCLRAGGNSRAGRFSLPTADVLNGGASAPEAALASQPPTVIEAYATTESGEASARHRHNQLWASSAPRRVTCITEKINEICVVTALPM